MRTIFIGDVHGCLTELTELIETLDPKEDDRVIFLWDLINKWPDSARVVKFVFSRGYECICGNHELSYRRGYGKVHRYAKLREKLSESEHAWLLGLPAYLETDDFIAVHAGLVPGKELADDDLPMLSEIRTWNVENGEIWTEKDPPWHAFYNGKKPVFYGHWAVQGLSIGKNNTFGLDDGCVYGGNLAAYVLETGEVVKVVAKRAYKGVPNLSKTVAIIAHNEESHIADCLASVMGQTTKPDQIVVVVHNSTDRTAEIARSFEGVDVDELATDGVGPIFPRIRAFELAQCEAVACIDGDSVADPDWLLRVTAPLSNPNVSVVGGKVGFFSDLFGNIASWFFFSVGQINPFFHFYFWGANFACRKSDYFRVGWLVPFLEIHGKLGLHFWAEDCYLSLALEQVGKAFYERRAKVRAYPSTTANSLDRSKKQESDRKKLFRYFGIR